MFVGMAVSQAVHLAERESELAVHTRTELAVVESDLPPGETVGVPTLCGVEHCHPQHVGRGAGSVNITDSAPVPG